MLANLFASSVIAFDDNICAAESDAASVSSSMINSSFT